MANNSESRTTNVASRLKIINAIGHVVSSWKLYFKVAPALSTRVGLMLSQTDAPFENFNEAFFF